MKRRQTDVNVGLSCPQRVKEAKGRNLINPPLPLPIFHVYNTTWVELPSVEEDPRRPGAGRLKNEDGEKKKYGISEKEKWKNT